jgi:hypothetical protein
VLNVVDFEGQIGSASGKKGDEKVGAVSGDVKELVSDGVTFQEPDSHSAAL